MDTGLEDDSVDYDYIDRDINATNNADIYVACATYKGKIGACLLFWNISGFVWRNDYFSSS